MNTTWTYELAMAAARDAADRRMREAGRAHWNLADRNHAAAEFHRLFPLHDRAQVRGRKPSAP